MGQVGDFGVALGRPFDVARDCGGEETLVGRPGDAGEGLLGWEREREGDGEGGRRRRRDRGRAGQGWTKRRNIQKENEA